MKQIKVIKLKTYITKKKKPITQLTSSKSVATAP